MRWLAGLPKGLQIALIASALGVVAALVAGLAEAPVWLIVVLALGPGLLTGIGDLLLHWEWQREKGSERSRRQQTEQDRERVAEQEFQREARAALVFWPAPLVSESDPFALGVARPVPSLMNVMSNGLGPYIARDKDAEVPVKLRAQGRLLLVGDPGSGVTRTAYEAACASGDERVVVAPIAPDGPSKVFTLGLPARMPGARVVLWLDRIDAYSLAGLTPQLLGDLRGEWPGLRVIATISPLAYADWSSTNPRLAAEFDVVRLERVPSAREREDAAAAFGDLDVSHGIGAAFTGLGALLARYTTGDVACPFEPPGSTCEISRAVVAAAAAWWGTGTTRPLTRGILGREVTPICGLADPPCSEHVERALAWAGEPVPQGVSLLDTPVRGDGGAIHIEGRLVELISAGNPPSRAAWDAALTDAATAEDTEAVGRIGLHAHQVLIRETARTRLTPEQRKDLQQNLWSDLEAVAREAWSAIPSLDSPGASRLFEAVEVADSAQRLWLAVEPLRRILELHEQHYGPEHPETARTLNKLGRALLALGEPAEARDLHERALGINERHYESEHPKTARTLNNLGNALSELGEPAEARDLHERALGINERHYGPEHPETARTLNNLGNALFELGEPAEARPLYERALGIKERHYGPEHPDTAGTLNNLGNALLELNEPAEARPLYERALGINERHYGPEHPETARTLNNLGNALSELGKPAEGRPLCERALRINERHYGPEHPDIAIILNNLGNALLELNEPAEARPLCERALRIHERHYESEHPETAITLNNLGRALSELNEPAEARPLFKRALRIDEQHYGSEHTKTAGTLDNLGNALIQAGEPAEAADPYIRSWRIYRSELGANHWLTQSVVRSLRALGYIPLDNGDVVPPPRDD